MIGESYINVTSGGVKRLSAIVSSLSVLMILLVGTPLIKVIPVSALAGLMFYVVFKTFYWNTFKIIHKIKIA